MASFAMTCPHGWRVWVNTVLIVDWECQLLLLAFSRLLSWQISHSGVLVLCLAFYSAALTIAAINHLSLGLCINSLLFFILLAFSTISLYISSETSNSSLHRLFFNVINVIFDPLLIILYNFVLLFTLFARVITHYGTNNILILFLVLEERLLSSRILRLSVNGRLVIYSILWFLLFILISTQTCRFDTCSQWSPDQARG